MATRLRADPGGGSRHCRGRTGQVEHYDPRGAFGSSATYADILPAAWHDYLILETEAAKISGYEGQRVPGLLQTRDYARALAETLGF